MTNIQERIANKFEMNLLIPIIGNYFEIELFNVPNKNVTFDSIIHHICIQEDFIDKWSLIFYSHTFIICNN